MKKYTIIYSNSINKEEFTPFMKKQYFAIPVIPIKVAFKYDVMPAYNHFERAILNLLLSRKRYTNIEISSKLLIDLELVELIVNTLISKGDLDENRYVTQKAEDILKGLYKESVVTVKYAFYDLNRKRLLKETVVPNELNFVSVLFDEYSDFKSNNIDDYYRKLLFRADSHDFSINFSIIDLNLEKSVDRKNIETSLNKERLDTNEENRKVLISAEIIEIINHKHYLLSYVDTSISTVNTNRWNVKNPLTLKVDLDLQNFFYYSNSHKVVSLIIEALMKNRIDIINEDVDKKALLNFIKNQLFYTKIADKHNLFIEPIAYTIDSICLEKSNVVGQSTNMQLKETLKMAMIYFGQLFESLLYQSAIEYNKCDLLDLIETLDKNREISNSTLCYMSELMGFKINNNNISLFNTSRYDLKQMFKMGKEYVLSACIAMNILIGNSDKEYFINKLATKHSDLIVKLNRLKRIRDEKRHTTSHISVNIKDYLYIVFDIMELSFGYKVNQEKLDNYFKKENSLYDYSYSHEFIRNRVGTDFFVSNELKVVNIKNHLIEAHKKYSEEQSDYIASAHSIIEDLYKEMLKTIIANNKINIDFKLKDYFNSGKDFEKYIELLGFDIEIDQEIFETEVHKSLAVDISKTETYIKQGINNCFENATNRIKMQSLILLFKLNNTLVNNFINTQYDLKKLFKLTTIIMFLDRSHRQNNMYDKIQAEYIINELLDLVKNIYNNKKVINWRS